MKIAMFVEGQTEDIFVQKLIEHYFTPGKIQIKSKTCYGASCYIKFEDTHQYGEHLCMIYDVKGDQRVLSALKENYASMMANGVQYFVCLRDVKSQEYERFGDQIFCAIQKQIEKLDDKHVVYFHFAKMETETWFLAAPHLFIKIDPNLTLATIEQVTGKDLEQIDLEKDIPNPANEMDRILQHVGMTYKKSKNDVHKIVARIDWTELCLDARQKGKIPFFFRFLDDLERILG